jgi:uncharacterized membrane protein
VTRARDALDLDIGGHNSQRMNMIHVVRGLHIVSGCIAIAALAVPFATRKGGPAHRRFGRVFVIAVWIVAATSFFVCAYRLATSPSEDVRRAAVFLGYLSLMAANSARTALRVLRFKARTQRHREAIDILLPGGLLAGGIALAAWGQITGYTLALAFGIVGIVVAVRQLLYGLREPSSPLHWKYQHMQSMVGAAIAVTTAFLVVNVKAPGVPTHVSMLIWLGPTLVGLPAVLLAIRVLRAREASEAAEPRGLRAGGS